jgi:hypothetical protein
LYEMDYLQQGIPSFKVLWCFICCCHLAAPLKRVSVFRIRSVVSVVIDHRKGAWDELAKRGGRAEVDPKH